jgi:hypothetical protein
MFCFGLLLLIACLAGSWRGTISSLMSALLTMTMR